MELILGKNLLKQSWLGNGKNKPLRQGFPTVLWQRTPSAFRQMSMYPSAFRKLRMYPFSISTD